MIKKSATVFCAALLILLTACGRAAPEPPPSGLISDEAAIYAAVVRQLATKDDTFGGTLKPSTIYIMRTANDSAASPFIKETTDSTIITETQQNEISFELTDLNAHIAWVNKHPWWMSRRGCIITLGVIRPQEDGSVQLIGSIYVGNLAAGGTTYVLKNQNGVWTITGFTGPHWIS